MTYPAISSRRMPYDVDGTVIGYREASTFDGGIASWLTSSQMIEMNDEDMTSMWGSSNGGRYALWFFFPEKREIEAIAVVFKSNNAITLQGSNDTTSCRSICSSQ